ncbi:MAG: serine/threonine-protein kinase [Gemmatimonadaceae bacterium]
MTLATVGRDRAGRAVLLARELATRLAPASQSSESLLVLVAPTLGAGGPPGAPGSVPPPFTSVRVLERGRISAARECYVCANPRADAARFCEACGATMSIVVPGTTGEQSAAARLAAVRSATGPQLPIIGEMSSSDGGSVYFAREPHADSVLLALVPEIVVRGAPTPFVLNAMPAMEAIQPSLPSPPEAGADAAQPATRLTPPDTVAVEVDPLVGTLIDGKYRILRQLGQGGMGRVFDARHEQLRGRRAIKVMHPYLQSREDLVTRFYEEARNAERVKHEHVCSVHDFGSSDGVIYLAMEFIDGEALSALLKREGKLAPARVAIIVAQTAAALDAAHALKIVHRDVKPDNIMLCRRLDGRDQVKVVDFGISKALNRSELTGGGVDTQYGVVIGTLDYMSEEQRFGQEVDSRADVYALARTTVKMLLGELPEHGAWNTWSRDRVHPALAAVIGRGLARRDERYVSAGEFSRDLTRALHKWSPGPGGGWRDWPGQWAGRATRAVDVARARPRLVASVLATAVVLASVAAFVIARPPVPPDTTVAASAIDASPKAVRFEVQDSGAVPAQEVQIRSVSGASVGPLGVGDIEYDGATADWLARPTWRDGKATAPATLVLAPRAGAVPAGTYTARVRVSSVATREVVASITATLVVRATEQIIAGPGGGGPTGGPKGDDSTPADPCVAPRAQLARVKRLTDPESGTAGGARRVVVLVPALLPTLCLPAERIEAQFRLAEAYITLSQSELACGVLRKIEADAVSTPYAANVDLFLSRCR